MSTFFDRVRVTTSTTGTGTLTLGAAESGYQAMPAAADGKTVSFVIENGTAWEVGKGVYTHSGTTLTRTTIEASSNGGSALDLSGGSIVFVTFSAADANAARWLLQFRPYDNEPPTTNYATLDTRNGHPCLDFDTTTQEAAIFSAVLSQQYSGGGITVELHWAATSATTGTIGWDVAIERVGTTQDIDSDSFATAQTVTAATVSGTSGILSKTSVSITDGANMDSLAAGERFRIRIRRDVANDTAADDAELYNVVIRETV